LLNAYNINILGLYKASMDIQFILDPYTCGSYIINNSKKSNRGVSQLLREAITEISHRNVSVKSKFHISGASLFICKVNKWTLSQMKKIPWPNKVNKCYMGPVV